MNNIEIVICPVCLNRFNMGFALDATCYKQGYGVQCPHCRINIPKETIREVQSELKRKGCK